MARDALRMTLRLWVPTMAVLAAYSYLTRGTEEIANPLWWLGMGLVSLLGLFAWLWLRRWLWRVFRQ